MSDGKRFVGRVALVTGAASGIGRATALRMATEGAAVAVIDRDAEGAKQSASGISATGGKAKAYVCDVADSGRVAEVAAAVESDLGPVDVLVNVAGIGDPAAAGRIAEITDERWNMVLQVNLGGAFFFCRALLPGMMERGRGAVVNVSSLAGRSKSATGGLAYSSSKAGLLGMTRHLAFDYGPRGIRVNAICPGGVDTPMLRAGAAAATSVPEEAAARMTAYQYFMPIKRLSTPEEQAAAILFLASDDASYINGVALDVNGGLFMA